MASITCNNIVKRYGDLQVVHDFSLDVHEHEFIVFLGPSGCGKSTILRMIAGLEDISGGEVVIAGQIVNDLPPRERGIAMVFQNYALYPHMNVFDNIAFGLKRLKTPKPEIERRVREVAATLGLEPYLERRPSALSGGQQQRVAIARAIIKTPKVFLFDEPLSNLDAKLRNHMRIEIARLHQLHKTTSVYVTHDQHEAMTLADRIVLLRDGRVEQIGTPREIYSRPRSKFVAGFIGSPPMNFLPMASVMESNTIRFEGSGFALTMDRSRCLFSDARDVVVGVRPGHITIADEDAPNRITGKAELVEYLGNECLVTIKVGGEDWSVIVPADAAPTIGEVVAFCVPADKIRVFDSETELSLIREVVDG